MGAVMKPSQNPSSRNVIFAVAIQSAYWFVNKVDLPARAIPTLINETQFATHPIGAFVYLTQCLLLLTALKISDDSVRLRHTIFAAGLLGLTIHLLFPTFIPNSGGSWREGVLTGVLDQSKNAFPSLHVAISLVCAVLVDCQNPSVRAWSWKRMSIVAWASFVTISTMTTRQHRLLDVLGGIALGVIAVNMTRRVTRYNKSVLGPLVLRLLIAASVAVALCLRSIEVGDRYTTTVLMLASIVWGAIAATVGIITLHEVTHIQRESQSHFARVFAHFLALFLLVGVESFNSTHDLHHKAPATKADPYAFCAPRGRVAFAFSLHARVIAWSFRPGTSSAVRISEFLSLLLLLFLGLASYLASTINPLFIYLLSVLGGFAIIGDHTHQTHPYGRAPEDGKSTYDVDLPLADWFGCSFWSTHSNHHGHTPRSGLC
jgi:membrane-associated phospholipid phosphatase